MLTQLEPALVQRCHRYRKAVGAFVHDPAVVESCEPTPALPETTGELENAGLRSPLTGVDGADGTYVEAGPTALVARTSERISCPTSAEPTEYCEPVAPAMSAQCKPLLSQRCHRYT